MGGGQRPGRVAATEEIVEHVQAEVVAAGAEDGTLHLRTGHEQVDLHLAAVALTLEAGVDAEHAVGPGEGGDGAGALFQRHGHVVVADAADDHPPELLDARGRGQVAGEQRRHGLHHRQVEPLHARQERYHELLHGDDRGHRVAGHADHRGLVDHAEDGRLAGHDGHPVDQHLAQFLDQLHRVVGAARRRTGVDQHQVRAPGQFVPQPLTDGLGLVRDHQRHPHLGPGLFGQGGEHGAVRLDDPAGGHGVAEFVQLDQFVAGGDDGHPRPPPHRHGGAAAGEQGADVRRPEAVAGGEEQLGGDDVLTHLAHVLPGIDRRADHRFRVRLVEQHVLDHDHRVPVRRQRVAGVHHDCLAVVQPQGERALVAGAEGVLGAYRQPVHGGRMERGRGKAGAHRAGGHPAAGRARGHGFRLGAPVGEAVEEQLPGLGAGTHLQVDFSFHGDKPPGKGSEHGVGRPTGLRDTGRTRPFRVTVGILVVRGNGARFRGRAAPWLRHLGPTPRCRGPRAAGRGPG